MGENLLNIVRNWGGKIMLNKKILIETTSRQKYEEIKAILTINKIPWSVKIVDVYNGGLNMHRQRTGNLGERQALIFRVYVKKGFFDKAIYLVNNHAR